MSDLIERLRLPLADCLVLGQQRGGLAKVADAQLARAIWELVADANNYLRSSPTARLRGWARAVEKALVDAGIPKPEMPR